MILCHIRSMENKATNSLMSNTTYSEILKVWNDETPDDFAIFSELYYQMFGGEFEIPYTTQSTTSSFFPYD